ncbi:MAG: hypothetical protein U9N61_08065 [Euryarchaeota archaeon]|nr:hypothetical protein [Euryarchaeota archaeon]
MRALFLGSASLLFLLLLMSVSANDLSVVDYDTILGADSLDKNVDTFYTQEMRIGELDGIWTNVGYEMEKNWSQDSVFAHYMGALDRSNYRIIGGAILADSIRSDTIIWHANYLNRATVNMGNWMKVRFIVRRDTLPVDTVTAYEGNVYENKYKAWITTVP